MVVLVVVVSIVAYPMVKDRLPDSFTGTLDQFGNKDSPYEPTDFGNSLGLNLFMYNGMSSANIGDGSTDEIYIIEIGEGGSFEDIVDKLKEFPQVIFTPHNAFNTIEAVDRKAKQSIEQIEFYLEKSNFKWPIPNKNSI